MNTILADVNMSMSWKVNSYYLLTEADDEASFAAAVKWCGVGGNVARTVSKADFEEFAKYIFENKQAILDGTFDLSTVKAFSGSQPISWVSKICHILNPKAYSLIYDSKVRKLLKISSIEEFCEHYVDKGQTTSNKKHKNWMEAINQDRHYLYEMDSYLWAGAK